MSEETFSIIAPFSDVASLAQGYVNRADGERLLLPLPREMASGTVVRFVVHLADGTPAFAGVGLCSQSSDQGSSVEPDDRYETLLEGLRFDARSQPVYDYIVAVRASLYTQSADASAAQPQVEVEAESESFVDTSAEVDVDATAVHDLFAQHRQETVRPHGQSTRPPTATSSNVVSTTPPPDGGAEAEPELAMRGASSTVPPSVSRDPSFVPPPIPTGLLRRPARTMHWQPAPPRRPTPRPASGLFRYGLAGLPRPSRPPRPDIDPAVWVRAAPRPA